MNSPTGTTIQPTSKLYIGGDPTRWGLRNIVPQNPGWNGPVALAIVAPVVGTLVLSPARAGSLALLDPDWLGNGWVPAAVEIPKLYVPTGTALTAQNASTLLYPLAAPDNDTQALIQKLTDAMSGTGKTVTVALGTGIGGVAVLNGAVLPYAVVAA
jgi:hypothetical protein